MGPQGRYCPAFQPNREDGMLIRVEYRNHHYDMVHDFYLEALIAAGALRRFIRSGGWVEVGRDPLRTEDGRLAGIDRRSPVVHRPLDVPVRIAGRKVLPIFGGQLKP